MRRLTLPFLFVSFLLVITSVGGAVDFQTRTVGFQILGIGFYTDDSIEALVNEMDDYPNRHLEVAVLADGLRNVERVKRDTYRKLLNLTKSLLPRLSNEGSLTVTVHLDFNGDTKTFEAGLLSALKKGTLNKAAVKNFDRRVKGYLVNYVGPLVTWLNANPEHMNKIRLVICPLLEDEKVPKSDYVRVVNRLNSLIQKQRLPFNIYIRRSLIFGDNPGDQTRQTYVKQTQEIGYKTADGKKRRLELELHGTPAQFKAAARYAIKPIVYCNDGPLVYFDDSERSIYEHNTPIQSNDKVSASSFFEEYHSRDVSLLLWRPAYNAIRPDNTKSTTYFDIFGSPWDFERRAIQSTLKNVK